MSIHAIRIHETGGPEVLKYESVPKPEPKAGEILVKNEASGINFIDIYHRSGLYKLPLPIILGREGSGVVEKVGDGVTDFHVGDRVAYLSGASYAEFTTAPATSAHKLPESIATKLGAVLLLQGLTAHYLVRSTYPLNEKHTVLIHAGAGGLGQILIQVSKILGAKVITTVSTPEKAEIVKKLGADHVINYTTEDFQKETRRLTDGKGVNVVYDSVGANTYKGSLTSLAPLGYLVLLGNASGPVPPIDPLELSNNGSLFLTRPSLMHYIATPEIFHERCRELFEWVSSGKLKVSAPIEFPLKDAAKAHEALGSRNTTGKLILIP